MHSRKGKGKRQSARRRPQQNSSTLTRFTGPIRLPLTSGQAAISPINTSYFTAINANVSGTFDFSFASGLVTSLPDWSNFAATYHEYRVLGFEVIYQPIVSYTSSYPPWIWASDRATGATLGSYAIGASHESAIIRSPRYACTHSIKLNGVEEAVWTPTSTTFSWGWIKIFGTGYTSNQNIGLAIVKFLIQFRGVS
jgi:hypothetical protein